MNPEPFRHWVWSRVPAHSLATLHQFVQDLAGVEAGVAVDRFTSIEHGGHRPLDTDPNYDPEYGWCRLHLVVFESNVWESTWGGHLELWGEHDVAPAISYNPAPGRAILLEYGDRNWWGFPIPVRGPHTLRLFEVVYYSANPPEGATAPHAGFPHPKGQLCPEQW